MLTTNLYLSRG